MATLITAIAVIAREGVSRPIDGTFATGRMLDDDIRAVAIGMVVLRSVNMARAQGYHMADPNAFVRVEFKHVQ